MGSKAGFRFQVSGCRKVGRNKRGGIGNFLSFFGATIFIILILGLYFFGGALIEKFDRSAADGKLVVQNETDLGLENVFTYNEVYVNLTRAKVLVASGKGVDEALKEVGLR